MSVQTVLVATDLTRDSVGALAHAVELAQGSPSMKLHLAHVKPGSMAAVVPEPYLSTSQLLRDDGGGVRLELWRLQHLVLESGVDCDVHLLEGSPAAEILGLAERIGADLIVMGGRGTGRLRWLLFGSISERVSQSAPCAVTVVRSGLASAAWLQFLERDAVRHASVTTPSEL